MLDGAARKWVDPALNAVAARLAARAVDPNVITLAGFIIGLIAAAMIAFAMPTPLAVALLLASRMADGLDGAVARASGRTSDAGGFLDIVLDFAFYGAVPLAFALRAPDANAMPAAVLLFAFYVNGASFLAYAAIAARRGMDDAPRGPKALVFTAGLAEATETIVVFIAMILWPAWFPALAGAFAGLCLLSAILRIRLALTGFRE